MVIYVGRVFEVLYFHLLPSLRAKKTVKTFCKKWPAIISFSRWHALQHKQAPFPQEHKKGLSHLMLQVA
jgi:hypothetical protein